MKDSSRGKERSFGSSSVAHTHFDGKEIPLFKRIAPVLAAVLCAAGTPFVSAPEAFGSSAPAAPTCVVSLSPTATETLFAIGAGSQVKAVDDDSNYPTKGLPKKRVNALNPSVEAIIGICRGPRAIPPQSPTW